MKLSLSALKQYLDTTATQQEIADKLTSIGLEVEEIVDKGADLEGFIIAEIKAVENHPNADKLHILRVSTGDEIIQVVCGAPNVYEGMKSILARPGVMIPCYGERLEKGVIRGVESMGMLCSEKELNMGTDHSGVLDLKTDLPAGTPATELFSSDVIFDVNVTPNRGDCFGVKGIAQDLSATGIGTFLYQEPVPVKGTFDSPIQIHMEDENCPEFVGRYIKNVKNGPSPKWMQDFLISMGLRPISALVDITNYMNVAECRPLHVFDADKLTGDIYVRSAKEGETLKALDEKEYSLQEGMTVIADAQKAQSIAGIMGGEETGCTEETVNVFLEAAYFNPISIAATGRILNAESDSRTRFERGIDPASQILANEKATKLILDICGGEASHIIVAGQGVKWEHVIDFDFNEIKRLCGFEIPQEKAVSILEKLGFKVEGNKIHVPSWRSNDVKLKADVVEEIVRIYGLDELPNAPLRPVNLATSILLSHQKREVAIRRALANRGLNQAITWSFMDSKLAKYFDSKGIKISNPIASDLDEMRPSLIPNLLSAVKRNQDRGIKDVQLFEVGPEFYSTVPNEQRMVAAGVRAGNFYPRHFMAEQRGVDVFDAKADALDALCAIEAPQNLQIARRAPSWYHPGRSGSFVLGKNVIAHFGEIHPAILKVFDIKTPVSAFEIYMDNVPQPRQKSKSQKLLKMSNLMPLTRDFAFVADKQVEASKIMSAILNVDKEKITDVSIFDVYEGDKLPQDKKSLAVQVTISPMDKTMTDKEIEILSVQIINAVKKTTGAELRA
ncbi:MAG: phenylalanine--tRNA ligase subunit beta [Alphaproteobacteria bacterium]|nr:phenylalanine--tRNA ligase subunit beta [Alphaproteobacteria bacterium]